MNKVLILIENPLIENRDIEKYGLDFFLKNNYEITIVDCKLLVNKKHTWKFINHSYETKNINNFFELETLLKTNNCIFALDFLAYSKAAFKIRKLLQKNNIVTIKKQNVSVDYSKYFTNKFISIKRAFLKNYFFANGFKHSIGISSSLMSDKNFFMERSLKKIYSHNYDYEQVLNYKDEYYKQEKKYILFLDDMIFNHPDYKHYFPPKPNPTGEDIYFKELNLFFKKVEDQTGFEVIISLHPKSSPKKWQTIFPHIKIFSFATLKLVKNAEFIFAHETTAISYPVIFKKTVIFLSSDEIENSWIFKYIVEKANSLKSKIINITKFNSANTKLNFDNFNLEAYKIYSDNYLKHPLSKEVSYWESLLKNINK